MFEFVILQHTLFDQTSVSQELDELARLELTRIHGITETAVVSEDTLYQLSLLMV